MWVNVMALAEIHEFFVKLGLVVHTSGTRKLLPVLRLEKGYWLLTNL